MVFLIVSDSFFPTLHRFPQINRPKDDRQREPQANHANADEEVYICLGVTNGRAMLQVE